MADYMETPNRPNIKPTGLPPVGTPTTPMTDRPVRASSGMGPALGAVAVVGIVALVAWGVMNNDAGTDDGQAVPSAQQTTSDPAPLVAPTPPEVTAPAEQTTAPEATPQEVPAPAPEQAPVPAPTPAPAPTN